MFFISHNPALPAAHSPWFVQQEGNLLGQKNVSVYFCSTVPREWLIQCEVHHMPTTMSKPSSLKEILCRTQAPRKSLEKKPCTMCWWYIFLTQPPRNSVEKKSLTLWVGGLSGVGMGLHGRCSKSEAALIRKFAERLPAYVLDKQVFHTPQHFQALRR